MTSTDTPSVSESRMNSWRFSVQVWPTAVRNSIAPIHSASVNFTSRTKSCRCVTSEVMTRLKRGSSHCESRSITAWVMLCSLNSRMSFPLVCLASAPQPARGDLRPFHQRLQFQVRDVRFHRSETGEGPKAAVGARHDPLAPDHLGKALDALGDQLRMLDVVGGGGQQSRDHDFVIRNAGV